ncbi:MAG: DUF362 domain-containing protein [Polyangiaceae bacterium]|nr:DUF362 domain-containing protein [Polyangiaceae bacterium]
MLGRPDHDTPEPVTLADDAEDRSATARSWSRRRFVVMSGAVLGVSAAAAAAGLLARDRWNRFGENPEATIRDHRVTPVRSAPSLVVARGKDPAKNVEAALARIGGIKHFIKPGELVLVKPNVGWDRTPAQAGNTDPNVVAAVVRACREAGAREVIVSDCPVSDPERSFVLSGIKETAVRAGARVLLPSEAGTKAVRLSAELGNWPVFSPLVDAAKVINLPVAKHHGASRVTAGMKNWIGITRYERSRFHAALHRTIVDLAVAVRPTLTIVDATRILMRNGPRGGNIDDVRETNAVAVSVDPVAVDAWATELLGARNDEVTHLTLAASRGLGKLDYRASGWVELTT